MSVRVRYAPSPTGLQHIGGVRTALFNYFYAKANKGKFILRIEDTDQGRYTKEALQDIYDTYSWLGIAWDEGPDVGGPCAPYFQSQRLEIYHKYAQELVQKGGAYYCYCTTSRLDTLREEQTKNNTATGYDRNCRNLTAQQQEELKLQNPNPVIRLKIPLEGATKFHDELLGDIERGNLDINPDPVMIKSDGYPTYHFANVVDDHCMEITHIMRAQEWIPSVPIHIVLYKAFGWQPPQFVHLPMVMGQDGHKLSKRHGSTSLIEFRKQGYLKEALINYVSLLGWGYDNVREFFSKEDLEELFTIKKLNKAPAVFDYKKLEWFNGSYIRKKTDLELKELIIPFLQEAGMISNPVDQKTDLLLDKIIPLIKERIKLLSEIPQTIGFFLQDLKEYDPAELIPKKGDKEKTIQILETLKSLMNSFETQTDEENETIFRQASEKINIKLGDFLMPLRVALSGTKVSPPLFESMRVMGKDIVINRIDNAINILKKN